MRPETPSIKYPSWRIGELKYIYIYSPLKQTNEERIKQSYDISEI